MALIYVAGPLFNSHERAYLEQIAALLEAAGYRTFLPHRDAGVVREFTPEVRRAAFRADLEALENCDMGVALLTGADHDSGTSAELGFLFARRKPILGLTDDIRWRNNFIWGLCGEGEALISRLEDVVPRVRQMLGEHG